METKMKTLLITAASIVAFSTAAIADVSIIKSTPTFTSKPITETVKVVKPGQPSQGFDLGSAILGGIVGNNIGDNGDNTAAGAILGGILGGQGTEDVVTYETRTVGYEQIHTGYTLTLNVDGVIKTINISK